MLTKNNNAIISKAIALAILATVLMTATTFANTHDVLAKKPEPKKTNVKIQVKINGIPVGTASLTATLTVGTTTITKTITVDENETSTAIVFNKIPAAKGDTATITIGDKTVSTTINELKKINKVTINLS